MLALNVVKAGTPFLLLLGVKGGLLPLKKRPYVPDLNDEARSASPARFEPQSSESQHHHSVLELESNHPSSSSQVNEMSSSDKFNLLKPGPLLNTRSKQQEMAFNHHQSIVISTQGRFYDSLSSQEKESITKARHYFHQRKTEARKVGNQHDIEKLKDVVNRLPTPYVFRTLPIGPLSKKQHLAMQRAKADKIARDKRQAEQFLEKEFGIKAPVLKRGRKGQDLSTMDPIRAKEIADKRIYYAQWNARKAARKQGGDIALEGATSNQHSSSMNHV